MTLSRGPRVASQRPAEARVRAPTLFGIVVASTLALRLAVLAVSGHATIDMNGSEYVRIAQNILAGHGAIGMRGEPVSDLSPLYSWITAFIAAFGLNAEAAALAIAVVCGTAFVALVYALASTVYDRTTALYAAVIAAVLPICVESSTMALSEALFGAAAVAGTLGFVRLLHNWSRRDALTCGIAFGIAYLLRPEGLLFAFAVCAAAMLVSMHRHLSFAPAAIMMLAAIALCIPGVAASYATTGRFELEGKSAINAQIAIGLRSRKSYLSVADGIDDAGRPIGPEIDPRYFRPGPDPSATPLQVRASLAFGAAVKHVRDTIATFAGREYGSGMLLALAALGLAATPWPPRRLGNELVLIGCLMCGYLALTSVWHFWSRYGLIFVPVAVLWAPHDTAKWRDWSARSGLPNLGLAAFALVLSISLVTDVAIARSADVPIERTAGAWIGSQTVRARLVDVTNPTAFYAGGTWSPLPYGGERAATRYLMALHPDYVVLDSRRAARISATTPLVRKRSAG